MPDRENEENVTNAVRLEHNHPQVTNYGKVEQITIIGKIANYFTDVNWLGSQIRVGFITIALLILISSVAAIMILLPERPRRMTGSFNVAVAGFDVVDSDKELEQWIVSEAERAARQIQNDLINFSKDSIAFDVWGPEKAGVVTGDNPEERAEKAEQLSTKIGADVVVYGVLDNTQTPWQLIVEFYVSPDIFYDVQEMFVDSQESNIDIRSDSSIYGVHSLGEPIFLTGLTSVDRVNVSSRLTSQTNFLAEVLTSLAYFHFFAPDYDRALSILEGTEHIADVDEQSLKVVYLLAGNFAGRIAVQDIDDSQHMSTYLAIAQNYYHKALAIDDQYARAYIGLGSVHYIRALEQFFRTGNPSDIDKTELAQSAIYYQQALTASNQPLLADITVKQHFGLGQTYLMQSFTGDTSMLSLALQEFQNVVTEYEETHNARIQELAAEAHARLGLIYSSSDEYFDMNLAVQEYEKAIDLTHNATRKARYQHRYNTLSGGS